VRRTPFVIVAVLALTLLAPAPPARAQCEELEARLAELTLQVQALEKQVRALVQLQQRLAAAAVPAPATAAPAAAAATGIPAAPATTQVGADGGRQEAIALYDRVDALVAGGKLDEARQAVAVFDEKYVGTQAAGWTRSLHRELEVVGKPVPAEWAIEKWFQGEGEIKLDGKQPTVIVFWESWCPHCRSEVPKLQQVYQSHKDAGLQVLGLTRITQTATEESVLTFVSDNSVGYPIAKETGAVAEYFNVKGIPAAAVVRDGKIVWRGHPTRLTEALLSNWL
jgi:thiol-disulfide isomerase/thioredoxin